ncbi:MAG: 30S ribosome-binding factor RbfA [Deltaproteobacteria bacterium]|nr:30S ribosome-binding factor RbfA [Deltaproteobacteria bacterium]
MVGEVKRSVRVAERVRQEIATVLDRDVEDPRLRRVVITRVEVSDDLQHARVLVRLSHDDSPEQRKNALRGLKGASAMLRRKLGAKLELRRTPELKFVFDDGQDAQTRVEALLAEIASGKTRQD